MTASTLCWHSRRSTASPRNWSSKWFGTVDAPAEPYRRTDGSYRVEYRFRFLIAVAS
jgi:hypothetical protein